MDTPLSFFERMSIDLTRTISSKGKPLVSAGSEATGPMCWAGGAARQRSRIPTPQM